MLKHFKTHPLTLSEKIGLALCVLALILSLVSTITENINLCSACDKTFLGSSYYDYTETMTLCEDCARTYWAPFSYKDFKIK